MECQAAEIFDEQIGRVSQTSSIYTFDHYFQESSKAHTKQPLQDTPVMFASDSTNYIDIDFLEDLEECHGESPTSTFPQGLLPTGDMLPISQTSDTSELESPFKMPFEERFSRLEDETYDPTSDDNSMDFDMDAFLAQLPCDISNIYDNCDIIHHNPISTVTSATPKCTSTITSLEISSNSIDAFWQSQATSLSSNISTSTSPSAPYSFPSSSGFTDTTNELNLNILSINSSPPSPISQDIAGSPTSRNIRSLSLPNTATSTRCSSPAHAPAASPNAPSPIRPAGRLDDSYSLALTSIASTLPSHIKERRYGSVFVKYCEDTARTAPYPASAPPSPSGVHRRTSLPSNTKFFCPVTDCNRSYELSHGDKGGFRTDNLGYHLRSVHGMPLQKKERALKWLERLVFE